QVPSGGRDLQRSPARGGTYPDSPVLGISLHEVCAVAAGGVAGPNAMQRIRPARAAPGGRPAGWIRPTAIPAGRHYKKGMPVGAAGGPKAGHEPLPGSALAPALGPGADGNDGTMSLLVRIYYNAVFGALGGLLGWLLFGVFGEKYSSATGL